MSFLEDAEFVIGDIRDGFFHERFFKKGFRGEGEAVMWDNSLVSILPIAVGAILIVSIIVLLNAVSPDPRKTGRLPRGRGARGASRRTLVVADVLVCVLVAVAGMEAAIILDQTVKAMDVWDRAAQVGEMWLSRHIAINHDAEGNFVRESNAWMRAVVDNFISHRADRYGEIWEVAFDEFHKLDYYYVRRVS